MAETCLEELVVDRVFTRGFTITTAESCTGGLVAATLINISGASDVLDSGYITYSNEAKEKLLGVSHETLKKYGAVSEQTAVEMAQGAARAAEADVAISTTGIAGPGGGTREKPVGLVYIGCYIQGTVYTRKCNLPGERKEVREAAVKEALTLLLEHL
ncbi:MAG: CinA family protein [Hespellia sp.]|nr:CinA family protein [Hespellia sp.]